MERRSFLSMVGAALLSKFNSPKKLVEETILYESPQIYSKKYLPSRKPNTLKALLLRMKDQFFTIEKVDYFCGKKFVRRFPFNTQMVYASKAYENMLPHFQSALVFLKKQSLTEEDVKKAFTHWRKIQQTMQDTFENENWRDTSSIISSLQGVTQTRSDVISSVKEACSKCIPVSRVDRYESSYDKWKSEQLMKDNFNE